MSRTIDPRRPRRLNLAQQAEVDRHPEVRLLRRRLKVLLQTFREQKRSIASTKGSPLFDHYRQAYQAHRNSKRRHEKALLIEVKEKYKKEHQFGLWFQATVGGLSVGHISRGVALLEDGGVVMLQDNIPLCVRYLTYTLVSRKSTQDPHLLTAVVESLPIAASEGIWTRRKFYAGNASEVGHLWAESGVSQSCLLRHLYAFRGIFAPPEQRSFCHLLLQGQA